MACEITICVYDRTRMPCDDAHFEDVFAKVSTVRQGLAITMPSGKSYPGVTLPGDARIDSGRVLAVVMVNEELLHLLAAGFKPASLTTVSVAEAEDQLI